MNEFVSMAIITITAAGCIAVYSCILQWLVTREASASLTDNLLPSDVEAQ